MITFINSESILINMYSERALYRIVEYYKERLKPAGIRELADTKRFPNDILLSYFISGEKLNRAELAAALSNLKNLEKKLQAHSPSPIPESDLPTLFDSVEYGMPTSSVAATISTRTKKFAMGSDNWLLVADKKINQYQFPSGHIVPYFSLVNENAANLSILFAGCSYLQPNEIYIRENFVAFILAFLHLIKQNPLLSQYQEQAKDFEDKVRGIVIAHEQSEIELVKSGKVPKTKLELELMTEELAKKFLGWYGIDTKYYELYHRLVESKDKTRGRNVSRMIVDQAFHPLD